MPPSYLALGDSYTIGEGVGAEQRWPEVLAAALRGRGVPVQAPRIIATTGWTTDELSQAMDAAGLQPGWGLVTLLIGVNNQYRGRSAGEYRREFQRLLNRAAALAGDARRTVVVSIPDWGVTPFAEGRDRAAIARDIDLFNAIARDESARAFARWVDVTTISRQHARMVTDDGLHPSAAQYALWAQAILPQARAALRELGAAASPG
jgi:lysophospholipase L1-like esterase